MMAQSSRMERANRALRYYGFTIRYNNERNMFMAERQSDDWIYQVFVEKKKKKISLDCYAFINGEFRRSWVNDKYMKARLSQLNEAVKYYVEKGEWPLPLAYPALWGWHQESKER